MRKYDSSEILNEDETKELYKEVERLLKTVSIDVSLPAKARCGTQFFDGKEYDAYKLFPDENRYGADFLFLPTDKFVKKTEGTVAKNNYKLQCLDDVGILGFHNNDLARILGQFHHEDIETITLEAHTIRDETKKWRFEAHDNSVEVPATAVAPEEFRGQLTVRMPKDGKFAGGLCFVPKMFTTKTPEGGYSITFEDRRYLTYQTKDGTHAATWKEIREALEGEKVSDFLHVSDKGSNHTLSENTK